MNVHLPEVSRAIHAATGSDFQIETCQPVAGGCIHDAFAISDGAHTYFLKTNRAAWLHMFEAESAGLGAMAETQSLRVPTPICSGMAEEKSFLVLEHISMQPLSQIAEQRLGKQLADLHRQGAQRFGWYRDNTIGSTPQQNSWTENWVDFFVSYRLGFQLALAETKGLQLAGADEVCARMNDFFAAGYDPPPSLLHGDLWSGNAAADDQGQPILFDPACYYGDREADVAFTEMFGGFSEAFYQSYREAWPLDAGYETRRELYNLYHQLNHYNLFGGGYGQQSQDTVKTLLSRLG